MGKSTISMAIFHRLPEGKPSRLPFVLKFKGWLHGSQHRQQVVHQLQVGASSAVAIKWWFTVDPQLEDRKIQLIQWDLWWFNQVLSNFINLRSEKKGFEQQK